MPDNATTTDLTACDQCTDRLVYPVSWRDLADDDSTDEDGWWLELRCPTCDTRREIVADHATVEAFDATLNAGTDALVEDCQRLTNANREDEITRFVNALEVDAVLPCDFGWP